MMGRNLAGLTLIISFAVQVFSVGMFQVSIMAIYNYRGQKEDGRCCDGYQERPPCTMECRTFFSFCLLHYVNVVPDTISCPFGHTLTPVLGGNSINDTALAVLNYFPLKMPFSYAWPGTFTLVIDVIHDGYFNRTRTDSSQRILRVVVIDTLYPPTTWIQKTSVSESVDLSFNFRVVCDENYYGPDCNVICRPRNDNLGHYLCDENGTKICIPGWEGEHCKHAICSDNCSITNGFCEEPFKCRCLMGWTGESCDQCLPHPKCLNGYCIQPSQCICKDGWRGEYCNIDTNFCMKTQPCLNGGTCIFDEKTNYTCLCPNYVTGHHCENRLCYPGFCQNGGRCRDEDHGPVCSCPPAYHGIRCEQDVPRCQDIACLNNGTCIMKEYGAACDCVLPFVGKRCEIYLDPCEPNPCSNGDCFSSGSSYVCDCVEGYKGSNCDTLVDLCEDFICKNSGTCIVSEEFPVCECPPQYTGTHCSTRIIDPCEKHKCFNGGSCKIIKSNSDFKCECLGDFTGPFCEQKRDFCENVVCHNGGICKKYSNFTKCVCEPHYVGKHCEDVLLQSDQSVTHPTLGNIDRDMHYINGCPSPVIDVVTILLLIYFEILISEI